VEASDAPRRLPDFAAASVQRRVRIPSFTRRSEWGLWVASAFYGCFSGRRIRRWAIGPRWGRVKLEAQGTHGMMMRDRNDGEIAVPLLEPLAKKSVPTVFKTPTSPAGASS
jgi:hypothetical protein